MKVTKLQSRTIDYTQYVFNGPISELPSELKSQRFIPLKSSYEGVKGELKLALEVNTQKIWVLAKKTDTLFTMFPSSIVPNKNATTEEKRIIIRRAVTSAYTAWLYNELDYQVCLNGTQVMTTPECWWF